MGDNITIKQATAKLKADLARFGIEQAGFEARLMVQKALKLKSTGELILLANKELDLDAINQLDVMTGQRLNGRPLQYILGSWEFMGLELICDERALIPRQDTETLCEIALGLIKARGYKTCLDMCCGSGCIGISLARFSNIATDFADISPNALSLTQENRNLYNIGGDLIKSDLFSNIIKKYDLIVCNPPYLTKEDMATLQKELLFEPANALYGGDDGLELYKRIARTYKDHLNENGALLLEVGMGQAQDVAALLGGADIAKDLNGIERVVIKG